MGILNTVKFNILNFCIIWITAGQNEILIFFSSYVRGSKLNISHKENLSGYLQTSPSLVGIFQTFTLQKKKKPYQMSQKYNVKTKNVSWILPHTRDHRKNLFLERIRIGFPP